MEFKDLKLAAYLNEAGEDPEKAASIIKEGGIDSVCLRRSWGRDIFRMADDACSLIKDILDQYNLKPVLLTSMIGDVPIQDIGGQRDDLDRALLICNFFGCPTLSLSFGNASRGGGTEKYFEHWMRLASEKCSAAAVRPVFEIDYHHYVHAPAAIASLLSEYRGWSILYDPALLVAKRRIHPFTKYWSLLKDSVSYLDIHDYASGAGPRPAGHGDAQIDLTVNDAVVSGYKGWYCLEPGLGRRYGDLTGKAEIFTHNLQAFRAMFARLEMGPVKLTEQARWHQR